MYFDRFDIVEAHYLFYSQYHEGQWSDGYKRLCKITSKLKYVPSPLFHGFDDLSDNSKEIYGVLVHKFYEKECRRLGKFQGCEPYVPYFWNEYGSDAEYIDGNSDWGWSVWSYAIEEKDVIIFPELEGRTELLLRENEQGFVYEEESWVVEEQVDEN